MHLTILILTKDEELHIQRCIESVKSIASEILVVDSGSTDRTISLARASGAKVLYNPWTNYATQLNWGLGQVSHEADWIMRLDADEVVMPDLANQISASLVGLGPEIDGVYVNRSMKFMGRSIRWGGLFPVKVIRLFRNGRGRCENRWMDEHIIVDGKSVSFSGHLVDDNLNSLTWWINKHNNYASREAIDLLNLEYGFLQQDTVASLSDGTQVGVKRWLKESVYSRLPGGFRAFLYFCYRYFLCLGFLDGREGAAFHVLQGFWYRYLVDVKLAEVRAYMRSGDHNVKDAIRDVLKIDLSGD